MPVQLTGLRASCNFFAWAESSSAALFALRQADPSPLELLSKRLGGSADLNVRIALSTLLLNVANAVVHGKKNDRDSALMAQCSRAATSLVGGLDEAHRRAILALGCVASFEKSLVKLDLVLSNMTSGDKNGDELNDLLMLVGN